MQEREQRRDSTSRLGCVAFFSLFFFFLYHQMEIYFLPVPAFRCRVFTTIKSMHEKGSNSYKTTTSWLIWRSNLDSNLTPALMHTIFCLICFFIKCPDQLVRVFSTNSTCLDVNDYISLQWSWDLWYSNRYFLKNKPKTWPVELNSRHNFL